MPMSNGTKAALGLGAVAGIAAFAWSRSSKADDKPADPQGDIDAKTLLEWATRGCNDGAADKADGKPSKVTATTGFESSPSTPQAAYDKAYQNCYSIGTVPVGPSDDTPPVMTPPPKPATIIFSPDKATDKARAHSLAVAIGNSPAIGAAASDINPDGTYKSLLAFSKYPANTAGLAALQQASGITVDGLYGTQTQLAFDYWFSHTS